MKLASLLIVSVFLTSCFAFAQEEKEIFTIEKNIKHLPVISQGSTGTCWSFATTSFFESELLRQGDPEIDLSEMFFVYHNYKTKAFKYLLYHGNNNFGQGSVSHDVLKIIREEGVATFDAYPGIQKDGRFNHRNLISKLKEEADDINKSKKGNLNISESKGFEKILDSEVGKLPKKMEVDGKNITAPELRDKLNINTDDYIELSSFSHHPFYKPFVLEIPDNWAHERYYNLPIDELMEVMYYALNNGFTVCWDGDTSEKTFTHKKGKADVTKKDMGEVDQALRQETFYNRTTTDDHLMHLVGLSKDSMGKNCFYTKNSWGADSNEYGGYLHMTEDYVRLKTIGILVHKDAIPETIKNKILF